MRVAQRILYGALVSLLSASLILPLPAWSAVASIGMARGIRTVELTLDGGKSWLPLGATSMPILDGAQVRSRNGGAVLDFADGSRLNILPFSSVAFRQAGTVAEVSVDHGRIAFQLPAQARVTIRTASARLEPVPDRPAAGEMFVGSDATVGVKMSQGNVRVEELTGARRTMTASIEPVFVPKRPATSGALFAVDAPAESPAAGAKAVFSPKGESLGFLQPDKQLVVRPGYTADLTQSFPPKTIQLAMAKIPSSDSGIAMPVFDVNGGYVGYLAGPTFHAQAIGTQSPPAGQVQMAQAVGAGGGAAAGGVNPWYIAGGVLLLTGLVIGGLCLADEWPCEDSNGGGAGAGGAGGSVGTALRPRR